MAIDVQTRTTYTAVCDDCGTRGPDRESAAEAEEAVTGARAALRAGFVLANAWRRMGKVHLFCSTCATKGQAHAP